jgi:ribA/ribD-fused uncharacterized protein
MSKRKIKIIFEDSEEEEDSSSEEEEDSIDFFTYKTKANKVFEKYNTRVNIQNEYNAFSNYYKINFEYENLLYSSSEHAYHSKKFNDEWYCEEIRKAKTPSVSKELGNMKSGQWSKDGVKSLIKEAKSRKIKIIPNWNEIKNDIMYEILCEKFKDKKLRKLLKNTGNKLIRECSPYDDYWGIGRYGKGENHLGLILMKIRREI